MAGLKAIKIKIRSIEKTQKVTKAMEAVSAAKMRKAQGRAFAGRAYARAAVSILARVSGSRELASHPLVCGTFERGAVATPTDSSHRLSAGIPIAPRSALYIVITSDKGLAGALNSAVLRATAADIKASGLLQKNVPIIAVGRKANDFFTARGFTVVSYQPNTDQIDPDFITELVHQAAALFQQGEVEVVKVAYQNFISTFEQRPTLRTIFPLSLTELEKVVNDIQATKRDVAAMPSNSRGEELQGVAATSRIANYTVEPSEAEVLAAILPRLASIFVYHALLEAQASEHSARMVSMKSASDKAVELTDKFTLQFNKARQAAITREVSEITGGMEAMAN
ncbi:MAG TPA: ATP synthase F1 subunit gamma [Candidatus Paceibacterota bacterium]